MVGGWVGDVVRHEFGGVAFGVRETPESGGTLGGWVLEQAVNAFFLVQTSVADVRPCWRLHATLGCQPRAVIFRPLTSKIRLCRYAVWVRKADRRHSSSSTQRNTG